MSRKLLKNLILCIILTTGVIIAAIGFSMGAGADYKKLLNLTNIEAVMPAEGVATLNIDVAYADLEISASNDSEDFEIYAENIPRSYLKYSCSNNILSLKYSFNKWYEVSSVPIMLKSPGKIKIVVPAAVLLQDIQIRSGINALSVNYLTAENVYIDCGAGQNELNSINADFIDINGSSGDTSATNLSCRKLLFNGSSGDTNISNFSTKKAVFNTGTGSAVLSGIIDGNSTIKSGIGDIDAQFFGSVNDYHIKLLKGDVNINGKKTSGTDKGKHEMNITSGMGDINIKFK